MTSTTSTLDREDLIAVARVFLAALERRDPTVAGLADTVRMTENMTELAAGDFGLFHHFVALRHPKQYVVDLPSQQIGVQAVIEDEVGEAILALRLRVVERSITEVEMLVAHDGESGPAFQPVGFLVRESPYIVPIPSPVRTSRDDLISIAAHYWQIATTTHDPATVPFSLNCFHLENGMNTDWEHVSGDIEYFESPPFAPQADGRRFKCSTDLQQSTRNWVGVRGERVLVDEERGLVMIWNLVDAVDEGAPFPPVDDPATAAVAFAKRLVADGFVADDVPPGLTARGMVRSAGPFTIYHAETQRIIGGEIDRQQVFMRILPAEAPSLW